MALIEESGASDVYFEDSIEILVSPGGKLDEAKAKEILQAKEIEFTSLERFASLK